MMMPGSRTYLCYEDGITSTGQIVPQNPACQAAVASSGITPLYNWFAVGNRSGATSGETSALIPDGKLCSGDSNYYDFSGFDQARSDWPVTHLTAGSTVQIQYNKWAAHPGTFSLYVTKDGWDPTKPLTWADLESTPFSSATLPPSVGSAGSVSSYYYWNATLPAGKTGYHIIYSIWARSDSTETFYGCSDVMFDGGSGQVTGIGAGAPPPPAASCSATYAVTSTWPGGFQAQVTITNPNTSAINSWTASWDLPDGETISSAWNGTLSQAGTLATMKSASWNGQLAAKASTSFGFTANYSSTPAVPTVSCSSP
ncbi:lytic polysaccharide monooxygenase [Actinocrinis puniceicyclus]|uniref:Lytic polysaccharide monooxygenase n=2 Tax=Actinocrinis puniceicyclus TaxID=977794 RepID=A0A8J8BC96_9ACTN|nr:lytic polysaccharide monooxygenase [Actinocrinis puniceicyclus]